MEVHWLLESKEPHNQCDFPQTYSICSGLNCEDLMRVEMSMCMKRTEHDGASLKSAACVITLRTFLVLIPKSENAL